MPREAQVVYNARNGRLSDEEIAYLANTHEDERVRMLLEEVLDNKGYNTVATD